MKFSVVIATYNRANLVARSIQSVQAQTFKDWELVIVDDGSTDATKEKVRAFQSDKRIRALFLPQNVGSSAARNAGIEAARGDWVLVWDSDDELAPEALSTLGSTIHSNPDAGVVSAPAVAVRGNEMLPAAHVADGWITTEEILCKRLGNYEKVRVSRRELFADAKYRGRNIDFMVNAYLARQTRWYHLSQPLGTLYIDNPDSLTRARRRRNATVAAARFPHLKEFMEHFGQSLITNCPNRYAAYAYGTSRAAQAAKEYRAGIKWAREAWKVRPFEFRYMLSCLTLGTLAFNSSISKVGIRKLIDKK